MKITWKLFLAVAAASAFACATFAAAPPAGGPQRAPGGPPGGMRHRPDPKAMVKELTKALTLSSSQQKKVLALFEKQHKQMEAMFKNHKPGQGGGRAAFEKMHTQMDKAMNAILTPKQRKLYAEWQAKHHHGRGGPGGPGRPGGPGGVRARTNSAK